MTFVMTFLWLNIGFAKKVLILSINILFILFFKEENSFNICFKKNIQPKSFTWKVLFPFSLKF